MEHHLAGKSKADVCEKPGFFYILSQEHDSLLSTERAGPGFRSLAGTLKAAGWTILVARQLPGRSIRSCAQAPTAWHRLLVTDAYAARRRPSAPVQPHQRTDLPLRRSAQRGSTPAQPTSGAARRMACRPPRCHDLLLLNAPARYLGCAACFPATGAIPRRSCSSRVEYERPSWLGYLPAIYAPGKGDPTFIYRSLALFQSMLDEQEAQIENCRACSTHSPPSRVVGLAGRVAGFRAG